MNDLLFSQIALAAAGGLVVNFLSLLEIHTIPKDRRPDFKDFFYWLPFIAWPMLGGFVGYLYFDAANPLSKMVCFQVGASSPLILKAVASTIPAQVKQQLPPGA